MWTLQSIDPADADLVFRLLPGSLKTIGREPGVDFVVDAALVSRVHCRLTLSDANELLLEDLGSTNGTFVNGTKVPKAVLSDGDKVSFFEGLRMKMLESEALQEQAMANGEAQFANSPSLHDEMMKAAMDGDAAHQALVVQFLNSEAVQAQMLALMLAKGGLWKALRGPGPAQMGA